MLIKYTHVLFPGMVHARNTHYPDYIKCCVVVC